MTSVFPPSIFCVLLSSLPLLLCYTFLFILKLILCMFFKALTALKARKGNLKLNYILAALYRESQLAHSIPSVNIMYVFNCCFYILVRRLNKH